MIDFYDILGLIGVSCSIGNYMRLQWQRDYAKHMAFSAGNLAGSILIIISLLHQWNLSAFVINCLGAAISAYGVYRCLKYIYKAQNTPVQPSETPQNEPAEA